MNNGYVNNVCITTQQDDKFILSCVKMRLKNIITTCNL